jgi:hypothetical protein
VTPREKAEELLHLVGGGVPVEHALPRVGWTPQAAYKWAMRSGATVLADIVRDTYSTQTAFNNRRRASHE